MEPRDRDALADILSAIRRVQGFAVPDRETFLSSDVLQDAVVRLCGQLQKVDICSRSLLLPEHLAGEGLQRRVQAHQGEVGQFRLGGKQAIEDAVFRAAVGIPVRHWIAAGAQAVLELNRQQLEALACQQLRQIGEQINRGRQWGSPDFEDKSIRVTP